VKAGVSGTALGPNKPAADVSIMLLLLPDVAAAAALPAKSAAGSAKLPSDRLRMYTLQGTYQHDMTSCFKVAYNTVPTAKTPTS
jgi:hypothetical protein